MEHVWDHCDKLGIWILGVEITPESKDVSEHPFVGSTAFLMGNEG